MKNFDTTLYFITDSTGFGEEEFLCRVEAALKGGVTLVQLREKDKTQAEAPILETLHSSPTLPYWLLQGVLPY